MKKNKGITLIALIITIIILIILAAITLNNLIGSDLIGLAGKAAGNYIDAEKEEASIIDELLGGSASGDQSTGSSSSSSESSGPPGPSDGTGSSEVANGLKGYQGKYVDIGLDTNGDNKVNDWEIFYATEDRIFLIAADYVPVAKLVAWNVIGSNTTLGANGFIKYHDPNYKYSVYWPSDPTEFLRLPTKPAYFLSLVMHTGYSLAGREKQTNAIAVSHLLNTTAWEGIKTAASNNDAIEFVIGGPTLELWCASWNEAIKDNVDNLVELEPTPEASGTGYKVKCNTKSSYSVYVGGSSSTTSLKVLDKYKTFFPHTMNFANCSSYWLASPSAAGEAYVVTVSYTGCVGSCGLPYVSLGVRPVVCLKSGVSLKYDAKKEYYAL